MADEIDRANDLIDSELSAALNRIRQQSKANVTAGSKVCMECGESMPQERQRLGFKLCVSCASESERRKSLFA